MAQTQFLTLSQAIALASKHGVTWRLLVGSKVDETNLCVSLTSADVDAIVALKFGDRGEVLLDRPSQSAADTRDYLYDEPLYRSEYLLELAKHGLCSEVRLLDAAQTFNQALREWAQLDERLRDPAQRSEVCVSYSGLTRAFSAIGIYLPAFTPNPD